MTSSRGAFAFTAAGGPVKFMQVAAVLCSFVKCQKYQADDVCFHCKPDQGLPFDVRCSKGYCKNNKDSNSCNINWRASRSDLATSS